MAFLRTTADVSIVAVIGAVFGIALWAVQVVVLALLLGPGDPFVIQFYSWLGAGLVTATGAMCLIWSTLIFYDDESATEGKEGDVR